MNYFYRIDGLGLVPGNKSSGFTFAVSSHALHRLRQVPFNELHQAHLMAEAQKRVGHAQLLGKRAVKEMSIRFHEETLCPRYFVSEPMFGGSLGAEPEVFSQLSQGMDVKRLTDRYGDEIRYTPHNVDAPKTALALLVLAQTWAEFALPYLGQAEQ